MTTLRPVAALAIDLTSPLPSMSICALGRAGAAQLDPFEILPQRRGDVTHKLILALRASHSGRLYTS
jgi:hypothetical protein